MAFSIVFGIPDMLRFWQTLQARRASGAATKDEVKLLKLLRKTFSLIANNPKHPGLHTHEIDELSARCGIKVFQSYCENRNPRAMRVYWAYGPKKEQITILEIEPHPNDAKSNAYKTVRLSRFGEIEP